MKHLLAALLIILLASTWGIADIFSQKPVKGAAFKKIKARSAFIFGDVKANPSKDGSLVEARVSEPALIAFKNSFPNVTASKWYRDGRRYLVAFKKNENVSRALYDAKGNLVYSFFYGYEKDLPVNVKEVAKGHYPDYDILLAIDVYENGRKFWVLNMGNQKKLVSIGVENGVVQEISRYRRAK